MFYNGDKWGIVQESGYNNMFRGENEVSLDDKNRLTIPSEYREELGELCFVTRGLAGRKCLAVFSEEKYKDFEKTVLEQNSSRAQYYYIAFARDRAPDKQGRILLTPKFIEHAELKKDVVVIGVLNRLEIWDKDNWEKFNDLSSFTEDEVEAHEKFFSI